MRVALGTRAFSGPQPTAYSLQPAPEPSVPEQIIAWLGPAIEPEAFEVGSEVRDQFLERNPASTRAFKLNHRGRWQADIYELARCKLNRLGITAVYGGGYRCFGDADRFFSYRRDGQTGRMATMVWRV
jgi:hypothetical protein